MAAGISRRPGIAYPVLVPNEQGYERARAAGAQEVAVFTAASEAFNLKNTNATVEQSLERFRPVLARAQADGVRVRGYVSTVLGCPYQGDVALAEVVRVSRSLHAMGCYEISLGDTIGVGTPGKARGMLKAVAAEVPMRPSQSTSTTPTGRPWPTSSPVGGRVAGARRGRQRRVSV